MASRYSYAWVLLGLTAGLVLTDAFGSTGNDAAVRRRPGRRDHRRHLCLQAGGKPVRRRCAGRRCRGARRAGWGHGRGPPLALGEEWLREHWPLVTRSTRKALAVPLLPLVWRWLEIQDFTQTAVTSHVTMIVPATIVRERHHNTIYERMAHRTLGCLLGSCTAIACLSVFSNDLPTAVLTLCAGIWVGNHIQSGYEGIGYLGTRFVLGFLVTFVQGPAPVASILPGLERLTGVLIGSAMLCLLILIWPLPDDA